MKTTTSSVLLDLFLAGSGLWSVHHKTGASTEEAVEPDRYSWKNWEDKLSLEISFEVAKMDAASQ